MIRAKKTGPKTYFGHQLASSRQRFVASIVEQTLMALPLFGMLWDSGIEYDFENSGHFILGFEDFFGILQAVAFGAIGYPLWQGNLGHQIMGLKIISSRTGDPVNTSTKGAVREGLKFLFFKLPFLSIDLFAETYAPAFNFFGTLTGNGPSAALLLLLLFLLCLTLGFVGIVMLIWDKKNQNLYDKLSKTLVVLDE
jgi:hypothetical protein